MFTWIERLLGYIILLFGNTWISTKLFHGTFLLIFTKKKKEKK